MSKKIYQPTFFDSKWWKKNYSIFRKAKKSTSKTEGPRYYAGLEKNFSQWNDFENVDFFEKKKSLVLHQWFFFSKKFAFSPRSRKTFLSEKGPVPHDFWPPPFLPRRAKIMVSANTTSYDILPEIVWSLLWEPRESLWQPRETFCQPRETLSFT